jgi:hypothetical protein
MPSTHVNMVNRDPENLCSWLVAQVSLRTSQILLVSTESHKLSFQHCQSPRSLNMQRNDENKITSGTG